MTTKPTHWATLICMLATAAILGCTSVFQVRGVEEPIKDDIILDLIETEDPSSAAAHRIKAVEARSVEPLKLCVSGAKRKLVGEVCKPEPEPFKMGILEVDKHGSLNPKQRRQVFDMLDKEARAARRSGSNLVIVLFIHGWHHGAGVCDYNLACLRRLVGGMANVYGSENRPDKRPPSRFVGLYFAWRGESIDKEGFNALTIYNRKRKAEKIGRSGATNLLLDIDEEYRRLKSLAQRKDRSVLMITAGHSLGGGMLLSALRQKLEGTVDEETYIRSSHATGEPPPGKRPRVTGFGDLSILLNPAIQASRFQAFADDLTAVIKDGNLAYDEEQTPVLLVVTSEADPATRKAFPLSRWLLPNNWFRGAAYRKALGHYDRYRTHELSSTLDVDHFFTSADREFACGCPLYVVGDGLAELPHPKAGASFGGRLETALPYAGGRARSKAGAEPRYELKRVFESGWDENAPFWVVRVDETVINSHNDIYNEALLRFVVVFLNTLFEKKGF
ncbi:MAG: hypothetical protein ACE5GX_10215 [Thermoanaerobaculia bacterium]